MANDENVTSGVLTVTVSSVFESCSLTFETCAILKTIQHTFTTRRNSLPSPVDNLNHSIKGNTTSESPSVYSITHIHLFSG